MGLFERYLTLWVALCMGAGILLGKAVPALVANLRPLEFGTGSQINVPIAGLIWLMIVPMMMKVDFASIRRGRSAAPRAVRDALCQLAGEAIFDGVHRLAVLPISICGLDTVGRRGSVHRGLHYSCCGALHSDGLCLELSDSR